MSHPMIEDFLWRGLLHSQTEGLEDALAEGPMTGYAGFDPTADSLHVGSLLPIMGLARLQQYGHQPIALIGGGTGMIGDPSGKSKERTLLSDDALQHNIRGIRKQLEHFLDFDARKNPALLLNNGDWLGTMGFIDFLRDVGKHFSVNHMMAKESVKRRLEGDEGISYTEFSYMLLQAYDFHYLNKEYGCQLQIGGSDQWGNITLGIDFIRRQKGGKAHGLVMPLVTNSNGTKFGKTESGNVWLDPERTSPYRFYQFWLNTSDEDALRYLKYFTLLDRNTILELERSQQEEPGKREVQHTLAEDVTKRVHGLEALENVKRASKIIFGGEITHIPAKDIADIFADVPSTEYPASAFAGEGKPILDLFAEVGLTKSKGEARRLLQGGGVNLNNQRVNDIGRNVTMDDSQEGQFLVLRKGSKHYHLVRITG